MSAKFYRVGGSVRDEIMGLTSKDVDYAVEVESWEALREAIVQRGGEIFLETPQYLTIRAKVPGLGTCDYVLCRRDSKSSDGRHPDTVQVGTILDDLARRDFTVNAMAIDEDGKLLDPHNGKWDIEHKYLKCVGDPKERFTEDGLRMIRALRFSITKGLEIVGSIENCLNDEDFFVPRLKAVSVERVRSELVGCFRFDTEATLHTLIYFPDLRRYLFKLKGLWLKPTTESR
jgi:tRNA nucleotidyltransferase (CCA-adding enzyme)